MFGAHLRAVDRPVGVAKLQNVFVALNGHGTEASQVWQLFRPGDATVDVGRAISLTTQLVWCAGGRRAFVECPAAMLAARIQGRGAKNFDFEPDSSRLRSRA
jgi:hypothetical protein